MSEIEKIKLEIAKKEEGLLKFIKGRKSLSVEPMEELRILHCRVSMLEMSERHKELNNCADKLIPKHRGNIPYRESRSKSYLLPVDNSEVFLNGYVGD